jgi:uncharacterized phage-associated protein
MQNLIDALTVAKYFIKIADTSSRKLTNKKLQKLLYYAQAWSLALNGKPIFSEEIEAWIHGPVVPIIYRHYKKFGFGQITDNSDLDSSKIKPHKSILDEVWMVYGKFDADYLELLTHNEDPWIFARSELDAAKASQAIISTEMMCSYYSSMLKKLS